MKQSKSLHNLYQPAEGNTRVLNEVPIPSPLTQRSPYSSKNELSSSRVPLNMNILMKIKEI